MDVQSERSVGSSSELMLALLESRTNKTRDESILNQNV